MKKGLFIFLTLSMGFVSCMKNDPFEEKQSSSLQSKLFINEYNGAGQPYAGAGANTEVQDANRYIELYNAGDTDIELAGFTLEYGGEETWRGGSGDKIPAKGYFVIQGTKKGQYPGSGNMMNKGLSANNGNITLDLLDKSGAIIDRYEKTPDLNDHPTLKNTVHLRIPDGGAWYYCKATLATKGVSNPSSGTLGIIQPMGEVVKQETPKVIDPQADYSKLKLNEVSGVGEDEDKFFELINMGDVDISLHGCQIYYNANGKEGESFPPNDDRLTWTGSEDQVIKAGQLFTLTGSKGGAFSTGLTATRILIITLKDPAGNVIDQCIRTKDTGTYAIKDKSFARIPDGTGNFYFATPTPNQKNGASPTGLTLVPVNP